MDVRLVVVAAGVFGLVAGCGSRTGSGDDSDTDTGGGGEDGATGLETTDTLGEGGDITSGDGGTSGADDGASDTQESTGADSGTTDTDGGGTGGGGSCTVHEDCASGYCLSFSDAPPDPLASCEAPPPGGATRITATVRDIATHDSVAGAQVDVAKALEVFTDPTGAQPLVNGTTDGEGRLDIQSGEPINASIGITALVSGTGLYLGATGVAAPVSGTEYGPGNDVHDLWAVRASTLTTWSAALGGDAEVQSFVPLGERGGSVGVIRSRATGTSVAGATVQSTSGPGSSAIIRYAEGAGFGTSATDASGLVVILNPGLAETFEAVVDGTPTGESIGVGSASGAVFMFSVDVE